MEWNGVVQNQGKNEWSEVQDEQLQMNIILCRHTLTKTSQIR